MIKQKKLTEVKNACNTETGMFGYIIHLSVSFFHIRYGTDLRSTILEDVDCSSSAYLTISQCSFSTLYSSYCQSNSRDVIVICCELSLIFNCICI